MRRIVTSVILVLAATISFAQTQAKVEASAHLAFKGVPIDGTLQEFVSKMEKNGFVKVSSEEGYALMVGEYASHKGSMVAIETLKHEDVVSKIAVMLPPGDTWTALSTDYFSMKKMLVETYGNPTDQVETFLGVAPVDDNA